LLNLPAAAAAGAGAGGACGAGFGLLFGAAWAVSHAAPGAVAATAGSLFLAGAVAGGAVGAVRALVDPEPVDWGFSRLKGFPHPSRARGSQNDPAKNPGRAAPPPGAAVGRLWAPRGWGRGFWRP
jgi:hypothetical protein